MGKKRGQSREVITTHTKKRKKSLKSVPLPPPLPNADRVDDDASEGQLSDDDLALFQASNGAQFNFLRDLPTQALDLEASQPRKANKGRVPAAQHAQHATLQRSDAAESEDEDVDTDASGEDEEGEAWERGPRKAPAAAALASKLKAGPLPIKTLTGDVVAPGKTSSSGRKERGEEDVDEDALLAAPVVAARNLQIAGVTLHDDLEDALKQKQLKQVEMERQKRELQKHRAAEEHREVESNFAGKNDVLQSLKTYDSAEARRQEAKKTMATAAQALLADPEGQVSKQLRILLALLHDRDAVVCRLAMLSLLAVFRDVIPGYRIRPVEEKEQEGVAVSKEVKKLWEFESALLKGYQSYLKGLLEASKASRDGRAAASHGRIAFRCMASLLATAPHFNYASDLLQAVVPGMASGDVAVRGYCCEAVSALVASALGSKEAGQTAVEAVQLVADLVKRRKCVAPIEVVTCLLPLSFPEIASGEDLEAAKAAAKSKKKKKKGGKRGTTKNRKDDVDRAFLEAEAVADRDTRRHQQSATLEALFEIFFRVIKTATASGVLKGVREGPPLPSSRFAKKFPLIEPTLQGLAKFSHLISVDYFQDLMTALEDLLASAALPPLVRLRCLLTAADILKGQGEALTVDRRNFYVHLYAALQRVVLDPLADVDSPLDLTNDGDDGVSEGQNRDHDTSNNRRAVFADGQNNHGHQHGHLNANQSGRVADVASSSKIAAASLRGSVPVLLTQVVEALVLDSKQLDAARQAAFAKRLGIVALAAGDSGAALGALAALHRLLRRTPRLRGMLENEHGGPSGSTAYKPMLEDPAEAGALAVPLWELSLLASHYHPHVAKAAIEIAEMNVTAAAAAAANQNISLKGVGSGGSGSSYNGERHSSVLPLGSQPSDLSLRYTTALGGFHPAPQAPPPASAAATANGQPKSKARNVAMQRREAGALDHAAEAAFVEGAMQGCQSTGAEATYNTAIDPASAETALQRHWAINRQFERNADLRKEHAVLMGQLRLFHEHLKQGQSVEVRRQMNKKLNR